MLLSSSKLSRLAIIGSPVAHSLSPCMQNAAFVAMGFPFEYIAMEVQPEELEVTLRSLPEKKFLGCNITHPHKQHALSFMDEISDHAQLLGSVNTVLIRHGKLHGTNTDGPGFIRAIKEKFNIEVKNLHILILGANGSTGRALATQCILEGCSKLTLAGRNEGALKKQSVFLSTLIDHPLTLATNNFFSKLVSTNNQEPINFSDQKEKTASQLKENSVHIAFQKKSIQTTLLDLESLANAIPKVDLIVNTTPIGMHPNDSSLIPASLFHSGQFLYDTTYKQGTTALMKEANKAGAHTANGYSMLLHQGALSFELWFEHVAPINVMRKALEKFADTIFIN